MNKLLVVILSILGGIETVFYIFTPIAIVVLWTSIVGFNNWTSYFFYGMGILATIFRGIKIGWMTK